MTKREKKEALRRSYAEHRDAAKAAVLAGNRKWQAHADAMAEAVEWETERIERPGRTCRTD